MISRKNRMNAKHVRRMRLESCQETSGSHQQHAVTSKAGIDWAKRTFSKAFECRLRVGRHRAHARIMGKSEPVG